MADHDDNAMIPAPDLPPFLAQNLIASQASLHAAVQQMAHLQLAGMRATFEALPIDRRDVWCQSMQANGYSPNQIAAITDKSYPTVNRHLNGKNS